MFNEDQIATDPVALSNEFSEVRDQQYGTSPVLYQLAEYKLLTKADVVKDRKVEDRTNTVTDRIVQIELQKGAADQEAEAEDVAPPKPKMRACTFPGI